MTVRKFRSIEEMSAARERELDAEPPFERFLRHCARYWKISPRVYPRGVFRFRSINEAQAARATLDRAAMRAPETKDQKPASD